MPRHPLEPRAIVARFDTAEDRYELHTGCQGAFGLSGGLAGLLGLKRDRIRVLVGDVGGSFGMKAAVYPEYICALVGAKQTGRPVRWRDDRTESFLADHGGRDIRMTGELALDAEGRILAVRLSGFANMGAYLTGMAPHIGTVNIRKNAASLYRTPVMVIESKCVMTNTPPVGPYRGAGRPDGNYFMERLMDQAARETGRDPVELRRLNLIDAAEMPYEAVSGETYDSGDFAAVLDRALRDGDWDGFDARKDASEAAGKLRGRGIACYLEATAPQGKEMGGLRFGADGRITIVTGTLDYGQGHETAFAQVLSDKLGIDYDRIDLLQGDSSELLVGGGTGGSRSIMATGNAIFEAADAVIEKGTQLAAHALEAAAADIEWADGGFRVAGTDRSISLMDLAFETAGKTGEDQVLDANLVTLSPPSTYPNGCHICEVEIDPETGVTRIVSYTAVNDFGTIINPLLVDGQVHGGVVQGAGQVLLEGAVFDQDGPDPERLADGLLPAARRRCALLHGRLPAVTRHHQPPWRQGLWRGRHHWRAAGGGECGDRRTRHPWRHRHRPASDTTAGLVGAQPLGRLPPAVAAQGRGVGQAHGGHRAGRDIGRMEDAEEAAPGGAVEAHGHEPALAWFVGLQHQDGLTHVTPMAEVDAAAFARNGPSSWH